MIYFIKFNCNIVHGSIFLTWAHDDGRMQRTMTYREQQEQQMAYTEQFV